MAKPVAGISSHEYFCWDSPWLSDGFQLFLWDHFLLYCVANYYTCRYCHAYNPVLCLERLYLLLKSQMFHFVIVST